ncbi:MAG: glutamine synthetase III [Oscillospiraceae bacterium]|jgi:glutamine synthetase|nr:glutamine synthetase III [Oscillospiraceae bacterium]
MADLVQTFGSMVFGDEVMRQRLPKDIYKSLRSTIRERRHLGLDVANVVASTMKDWACEKGATHFTHWFQPMTGTTAEKHESFIEPDGAGGVLAEFSGKELIRGEPDASSFPTGGIRATFEARGYTAWDPTSYAFIKGNVLCIPTAFCSYSGEALDKKTPLLRSMQAVAKQAERILKLLGDQDPPSVTTTVGAEQEYFLIDARILDQRPDLLYCGRTLFGGRPPRGQELDDHYFGALKPRIAAFMAELDEELWKLGILSKTRHNEVAPAQHELAPIYTTTNIAADQNQLTMEMMRVVAARHGLVCLLHEKPFAGINGSGKHNNWSIGTSAGENLLEPGETPSENARFLLFLAAVIQAVDDHQDLLRLSIATAGNDHRLGANEAPPAIVSVFLGDELTAILDSIKSGAAYNAPGKSQMTIGVDVLPRFPKDTTDRNRTSPFAFTGNKFEFRMPGSSLSISGPNFILNTIIAEALRKFADRLENASGVKAEIGLIIRDTITKHERIIFNGNNYAEEWIQEAKKRGLLNLASTVDALPLFGADANVALLDKHGVLSPAEVHSRTELLLENYYKTLNIEALTLSEMTRRGIIPAVMAFTQRVVKLIQTKREVSETLSVKTELALAESLSNLLERTVAGVEALEAAVAGAGACAETFACAKYYREKVFSGMQTLREAVDKLEALVPKPYWPYPSYGEILYSVR